MYLNVSVWGHCGLNNQIFLCDEVYYSNTIITILMQTLIPNCHFENSPSHFYPHIQNNNITPETSQNYKWHPITNKLYSVHC